jgi:hypothetical protein
MELRRKHLYFCLRHNSDFVELRVSLKPLRFIVLVAQELLALVPGLRVAQREQEPEPQVAQPERAPGLAVSFRNFRMYSQAQRFQMLSPVYRSS